MGPLFARQPASPAPAAVPPAAPASTELMRNSRPARDATANALHLVAILERLSPEARRIARGLLAGKNDKARELAAVLAGLSAKEAIGELEQLAEAVAHVRANPPAAAPRDFSTHLAAVQGLLTPVEVGQVLALLGKTEPATLETFKATLLDMAPKEAASWVRAQLAARSAGGADAAAERPDGESADSEPVNDESADGEIVVPLGHGLAQAIAMGIYAGGCALMRRRALQPVLPATEDATAETPTGEVISVDEAAAFLGLDRNTVYDAAGRNEIPHRRIGKRILLSRTQLVAWLGSCKAAPVRNG